MLQDHSPSLFKRVHILITIPFFALVIATTSVLVWSYSQTWQYVKLIIAVQTDSPPLPNINYELIINEFTLSLNDILTNYWKAPALSPAVAIFISTYLYPYCKVLIYLIIYFAPLKYKYQMSAVFQINQWNKIMFIPLVAIVIQCSTFSFTIVPPTPPLQNLTDDNAEAYPGKGVVVHMFVILFYALIDYILFAIVKATKDKPINSTNVQHTQKQIQKQYAPASYFGVFWRSFFVVLVISNLMLYLQAVTSAPVRFKLDGVLANFVPDKYVMNNVFENGNILLNTSLLNNTTARFLYYVWIYVFVIIPIIVCVLLIFIWMAPLFDKKYGFIYVPKYFIHILWFLQSWSAFDVFLLCQFGATQSNIENGTKYLLDHKFPAYCGPNGLVTEIFGEDCSWADAWFVWPLGLYILNVIMQWFIVIYTSKVFSINDKNKKNKIVDISSFSLHN